MDDFEEIRDEVEQKTRRAERRWCLNNGLLDPSVFTDRDLGFSEVREIYQQRDSGICGEDIQKTINAIHVPKKESWRESLATKYLQKILSRGLYGYAEIRKKIGKPLDAFNLSPLNHLYASQIIGLINPSGKIGIRKGIYHLSTGLSIVDKNILMEGVGWGAYPFASGGTILQKDFNDGYALSFDFSALAAGPFFLRDLVVLGQTPSFSGGGIYVHAVGVGWAIENVRVRNFTGRGLNIDSCGQHTLRKVDISACDDWPMRCYNSVDWQHYDVISQWGGTVDKAGAVYSGSAWGQVIGGHFEGYYAVHVNSSKVDFIGTQFEVPYVTAVFIQESDGVSLTSCFIYNPNSTDVAGGYGALVYKSKNVRIVNTRIIDDRTPHLMRYGIYEAPIGASGALYGYNKYIGNIILGALTAPIYYEYPSTSVLDNTGYNIIDVVKIHTSDLFDAVGLTDSANIWLQPADSVLDSVTMVLDTKFVAAGMTDLDVTVGDGGDPDGILAETMNLTSDALGTVYKDRGVYWNAVSGLYKSTATQWIAYSTAVGANLNTLSAGQATFYFKWHPA